MSPLERVCVHWLRAAAGGCGRLRAADGGVSHFAGVTFGRRRAQYGETPLMWAAQRGHADCARLLLDAGAYQKVKS